MNNTRVRTLILFILVSFLLFTACTLKIEFGKWYKMDGKLYEPVRPAWDVFNNLPSSDRLENIDTAIDSRNRIHLVGTFDGNIYYLYSEDNVWKYLNGKIANPENPEYPIIQNIETSPCLQIDSDDYPHISWEKDGYLYYMKWDGNNWITLDNKPTQTYNDYALKNINTEKLYDLYFELDSRNNPHFVFDTLFINKKRGIQRNDIGYFYWDGKDWLCADGNKLDTKSENIFGEDPKESPVCVSKNYSFSSFPSLVIDTENNPHISWQQTIDEYDDEGISINNISEIYYLHLKDNKWICADGSEYNPEIIPNNAQVAKLNYHTNKPILKLDKQNNPNIIFQVKVRPTAIAFTKWDGNDWVNIQGEKVTDESEINNYYLFSSDGFGHYLDFKIDSNDNPHFLWFHNYSSYTDGNRIEDFDELVYMNDVYYAQWNGEKMVCLDGSEYSDELFPNPANVSNVGFNYDAFLEIDSNGNPYVIHIDDYGVHKINGIITR